VSGFLSEVDVAVIGAGAAALPRRVGWSKPARFRCWFWRHASGPAARTWTVETHGIPMDLGGEWLHSADRKRLDAAGREARLYDP